MTSHWQSTWYPAPDQLKGILTGVWSVHAASTSELRARVLPDGSTSLLFQRQGAMLRSCDNAWRTWAHAAVSGPRTGSFDFSLGAGGQIFIVQLCPAGAMQVLGVPMSSLTDQSVELDAVMGPLPQELSEHMVSEASDGVCVHAIEHWLFRQVRAALLDADPLQLVVHEVDRHAGTLRIDALASYVNLSRRQLVRVTRKRLGTPPKLFGRIKRFNQAVQMGRFRSDLSWAQVALEAEYADQAHMTRDFVQLGGIRPSELRGDQAATIW